MIEELGNNNSQNKESTPSDSFANIPAPAAEIKIRTMQSDLASIAATGGGMPRFDKVVVEGLSISQVGGASSRQKKSNSALVIGTVLIVFLLLAALGWFGYSIFMKGSSSASSNAGQPSSQSATSSVQAYLQQTVVPTASPFIHSSLFKTPADQTITFSLSDGSGVQTASDLQTYNQKVLGKLAAASNKAKFIEIDVKGSDNKDLGIADLLSNSNAGIIDPSFLATHFKNDATFFAYRVGTDFRPGYVIALLPGENQFSLKSSIRTLESSSKIGGLFLEEVGAQSMGYN